jgi:hypothetical protein
MPRPCRHARDCDAVPRRLLALGDPIRSITVMEHALSRYAY